MFTGTTIVVIKKDGAVAMAGDGQVGLGNDMIVKQGAVKIRRLYKERILAGFAGSVADAFALFERFEGKLEETQGNLSRAAVQLAKEWRTDKYLRRLEALLVVADRETVLLISGNGEVIEPDDGIMAVGSGGGYALAAARALVRRTALSAAEIAREALEITAQICVHTNDRITLQELKE